jgi:hypothetical protein
MFWNKVRISTLIKLIRIMSFNVSWCDFHDLSCRFKSIHWHPKAHKYLPESILKTYNKINDICVIARKTFDEYQSCDHDRRMSVCFRSLETIMTKYYIVYAKSFWSNDCQCYWTQVKLWRQIDLSNCLSFLRTFRPLLI